MKGKIDRKHVGTLVLCMLLFVTTMGFIMYIFYTTNRNKVFEIGEKTTANTVQVVDEFLKENIDILGLEVESIEYMMSVDSTNAEIKKFMTESTNGYTRSIDAEFTGFYGYINGEYLDGTDWVPEPGFDAKSRPWYIDAVNAKGDTAVCPPYLDAKTGSIMISICRMFSDRDSVLSIDIDLDNLDVLVNDIYEEGYGECIILSADGMVVSSSLNDKATNYLNGEAGSEKKALATKCFDAKNTRFDMEFEGRKTIVFSREIRGDWRAVLIVDRKVIFRDTIRNMLICLSASLIIVVLLLWLVLDSNKKRFAAENTYRQVKAASSIYVGFVTVDMKEDTYDILFASPHITAAVDESKGGYSGVITDLMSKIATDDYRESVLAFIDPKTLHERLGQRNTITHEFVGKVSGWCRERYIVVDYAPDGKPAHVIYAVESINEAKLEEERLKTETTFDKLTGCFNRKAYSEAIDYYMEKPMEDDFVYLSMDVNGLKAVNDDFGHAAGDELLVGAATCMKVAIKPYGKLYRVGGDEFFAIIHGDDRVIDEVVKTIAVESARWKGKAVDNVSISVGVAAHKDNRMLSVLELGKLADKLMYEEKARYYAKKGIDRRSQQDAFSAICASYKKILLANLTFDNFKPIQVEADEISDAYGYDEHLSVWLENTAKLGIVHPEDKDAFLQNTNLEYLRHYFASGKKKLSLQYRRKINDEYQDVLLELVVAQKYADNNQLVYMYIKQLD